jgi:N-methylhydantoinase B
MDDHRLTKIDPFTAEIIRESLVAIADEMFVSMQRTSKSPIIYEVLDYAVGLTDAQARLIAQANGVTGFAGILTYTAASVLDKFEGRLQPGDIVMTNDPYSGGGTHLCDVAMVMPVFYRGKLMAFAANKGHWTEVGGKDAGSWTTDSTEIYQEGLQFPCIKVFEEGEPVQSILDLIAANVRLPDMTLGDLYAQAASLRVAARRFEELCDKYGAGGVEEGIAYLLAHGERLVREDMKRLPRGVFEAEDWIDDDGMTGYPVPVRVKVTITDDKFTADFTGSGGPVKGPINCTRTGLLSGMRLIFKAITNPHTHINEGCFSPLEVICPEGTIFTANRPAPVSTYWETMGYVSDLVWKALASQIPDRLTAGHFLSVCGVVLSGIHPDTGELTILVEPQAGGWGAGFDKDGEDGLVCIGDGETYIMPVEVCETRYGIIVDQYTYNVTPGGEGEHRGGRGLIRDYRIVGEQGAHLTSTFGRFKFPPWAVNGGHEGSSNYVEIIHADGRPNLVADKLARYHLQKGDIARLITATGGGWGDPKKRDPRLVAVDLKAGMIDLETAKGVYGIEK